MLAMLCTDTQGDLPALVVGRCGPVVRVVVYAYGSPPWGSAGWAEAWRLRAPTEGEARQLAYLQGAAILTRRARLWLALASAGSDTGSSRSI
jgi:hypothetical protein